MGNFESTSRHDLKKLAARLFKMYAYKHTALIDVQVSQVYRSYRRVDLIGCRSHRYIGLTDVQLSQVCSSHRYVSLTGV